ncbi:MAG TPA: hypothetical protein VGO45_08650 [Bacteroidia bacterium]|jgi:hypothetical protein|nr:hypothetical protein [Bacteroidia bacterium]
MKKTSSILLTLVSSLSLHWNLQAQNRGTDPDSLHHNTHVTGTATGHYHHWLHPFHHSANINPGRSGSSSGRARGNGNDNGPVTGHRSSGSIARGGFGSSGHSSSN